VPPWEWLWCSSYYLFNRKESPIPTKLREYVTKIYAQRGSKDPVGDFRQLLEEDKPEWRERAAKIKWLNPNREKTKEVRHNLKDLVKKLHEKGFRSWKLEVEHYSMLCQPHLSVVV